MTCTTRHYFPNLDLFFLHGSQKYETKDTKEWINSDGTKSKSISTEAKPSSTPYTCVSFNIPGSEDQRTATVYVMSPNANTTSNSTIPPINIIFIVKIVVPILAAACFTAVIMVFVHRRKRRERTGNAELSRKVSFYELWCLISWIYHLGEADVVKLLGTLNIDSTKVLSKHEIYRKLCTWKDMIDSSNEAESLENALKNAFDPDMEKYQRIWKLLCVPDNLVQPFTPTLVRGIVKKLIRRHCMRLTKENIEAHQIDGIEQDTNNDIFDTFTMIMDWINEQECSNYEKRCRLDDAFIRIGRYDMQDSFRTIGYRHEAGTLQEHPHPNAHKFDYKSLYDDDIAQFTEYVKHLPPEKKEDIYRRIELDRNKDGSYHNSSSSIIWKLKRYRDTILNNRSKNESLQEFTSLRQDVIKNTMYNENFVTDREIEDIVKLITTSNIEKFFRMLDIGNNEQHSVDSLLKILRYTKTTEILITFSGLRWNDVREILRNALTDICSDEYGLSLTELINIASHVGNDKMDCFLKHLGFKEEELKGCLDEKGDIDRVKIMALWKHHIYPVPYPYRNKLVAALRAAEQEELANKVLSGHHQSRKPNSDALHNIFSRLNDEMISKLAGLLQVGTPGNRDIDDTVSLLINWVTEWMGKFNPNDTGFLSNHMNERKKVNDMLFSNGFYELAKEIMLLERCHQHSS